MTNVLNIVKAHTNTSAKEEREKNMEINAGNVLIILLGIVICFWGIYFRKIVQGILSFICGCAFIYFILFLLAISGTIRDINDVAVIIIALIVGAVFAFISIKLERLLVTIQAVLITLIVSVIILGLIFTDINSAIVFIIGVIFSIILGYFTWLYYRYAFICETAVVGAIMINHIWLFEDTTYLNTAAVFLTIITASAGIIVQSRRLRKMEGKITDKIINNESKTISIHSIQWKTITGIFSDESVQKASISSLCAYEKGLVIVPVLVFGVGWTLNRYMFDASAVTQSFLESTWMFRYYFGPMLEGVFVSSIIYFIIYYELKVSAIYQLFYLVWWPVEIWASMKYGFSNLLDSDMRIVLFMILTYFIPWGIWNLMDRILYSEKMKIIVMTIMAVIWFPTISEFLTYGYFYMGFNMCNLFKWIGIIGGIFILVILRKNKKSKVN